MLKEEAYRRGDYFYDWSQTPRGLIRALYPCTVWHGGEDIYRRYHGSVIGGPTASPLASQIGYLESLQFNGTSDYIDIGNALQLRFTSAFTLSAWIRPTSFQTGMIISKYGTQFSYYLAILSSGKVRGLVSGDGIALTFTDTDGTLIANDTYHVVFRVTPNQQLRLYINGALAPSSAAICPASIFNSSASVYIGNRQSSNSFFPGNISDVRFYAEDLSESAIVELATNPWEIADPKRQFMPYSSGGEAQWEDISGATSNAHVLTADDVNNFSSYRCIVRGVNAAGTGPDNPSNELS